MLPGEQNLVILGQKPLREVLSIDLMASLRQTAVELSRNGTRSGFEREKSESKVNVRSALVETMGTGANDVIFLADNVLNTRQAVQLTVAAYGSLEGSVSGIEVKECHASVAIYMEQDVERFLERGRAVFRAQAREDVQRRQALTVAVREAVEQVLPTRLAEDLWKMVLGRRFEAFRRPQKEEGIEGSGNNKDGFATSP